MLALILIFAATMYRMQSSTNGLKYSEVLDLFQEGRVTGLTIDESSGEMSMTLDDIDPATGAPQRIIYKIPSQLRFMEDVNLEEYRAAYNEAHPDAPFEYDLIPQAEIPMIISALPTLLMVGVMIFFWVMMMRQAGGGGGKMANFGKARAKPLEDGRRVTFDDVAGADEEKEELEEIVEFLKDPSKFNILGARIPKGVLLMGPPGTGKTLLARAVSGEAGVPFFSISGSDFVEMFVGVGASRVRDLFDQAKKNAPSIVFIDEIDAVGRQRGAGLGGGHDEREQTLNQLLVEMDGFGANTGVIIIAATNRRDILDPALLRPGRFDRQILVGYPDVKGREAILKVHTRNKPLGPDVELDTIAKTTVGFTGADLENLVNEAALLAARRGRHAITMNDIQEATIKVVAGPEKRSHLIPEKDKRLTAFHEAGHAVCTYYCPTQSPVHQVSIVPRGMAGGFTLSLPEADVNYHTKREMEENIVVLLGGRMAEKLVLDDISTGASNDLERATATARSMVTRYGFSEKLGPVVYGHDQSEVFLGRDFTQNRDFSETVAAQIDDEIRAIIERAYVQAERILTEHMEQLHQVAEFLFEFEKIERDDFAALMGGDLSVFERNRSKKPLPDQKAERDASSGLPASRQTKREEPSPGKPAGPRPAEEPAAQPEAPSSPEDSDAKPEAAGPKAPEQNVLPQDNPWIVEPPRQEEPSWNQGSDPDNGKNL